jgi:hypothetical protein
LDNNELCNHKLKCKQTFLKHGLKMSSRILWLFRLIVHQITVCSYNRLTFPHVLYKSTRQIKWNL